MNGEKKIQIVNGKYDIAIDSEGDFVQDQGLETAILRRYYEIYN